MRNFTVESELHWKRSNFSYRPITYIYLFIYALDNVRQALVGSIWCSTERWGIGKWDLLMFTYDLHCRL